jgi:peptide/nickel transport system substrate-binding protein
MKIRDDSGHLYKVIYIPGGKYGREKLPAKSKMLIALVVIVLIAAGTLFYVNQQQQVTTTKTGTTTEAGLPVPNPDAIIEEVSDSPSTGFDPAIEWGARGNIVMENIYEMLVSVDGPRPDKFVPWLAQSWDVSPDGLTYTFRLRQGIKFQDGTPFNATAVKYSIDRAVLLHAEGGPEYLLAHEATMAIKGAPRYYHSDSVNKYNATEAQAYLAAGAVKVIDPYTVSITLEHPYAATIATLAFTVTAIVSPSYVIANCPGSAEMLGVVPGTSCDFMRMHPLGTGPYKLAEYTSKVRTVLTSFDGYWGGPDKRGPPRIKTYEIKYVAEIATRELDLFAGTTDGIAIQAANIFDLIDKDSWLNNQVIKPLKPGIRVWAAPTIQVSYMMLNPRYAPLDNVNFRKAIAYAFPYDTYIKQALNGFGTRLYAPLPPGMPGYDSSLDGFYTYNPDKAKALFQQAGWSGTLEVNIRTGDTNLRAGALLLKDSIAQIYPQVVIQIREVDTPTWSTLFRNFKTPISFGSWTMDIDDPADFLPNLVTPGGQTARFTQFAENQTLINLSNQAGSELDPVKRNQLYGIIQRAIMESAKDIFLARPTAIFAERDWVLPGDNSIGRAINNPIWGDGDGGLKGGYHPYYLTKAPTTPQVNVMIGPPLLATSFTPIAYAVSKYQKYIQ